MICPLCQQPDALNRENHSQRIFWRCSRCELTFLDPASRPTVPEERARYLTHENRVDDPKYRAFLNRLAEPLLERVSTGVGLDYGCGPGPALAAMLSEAGLTMNAYDPFFATDRRVLDQKYDVITCTEVMEHFHQPREEFDRLNRLLKPNGWLGFMTQFLEPEIDFSTWWYAKDPTHVGFYTRETLRWIAQQWSWRIDLCENGVVLFHKPC